MRNVFVSVDPYMRGRMTGVETYVAAFEVGASDRRWRGRARRRRHAIRGFAEGDWVVSQLGWREQGVVAADRLRKIDPSLAPPSTALGVLGMPGFTAWVGLEVIGRVKEGETIYVSGAAGAVGSAAAQIARLKGLRVIGSAGSAEKVDWLALARRRGVQLPRDAGEGGARRRDRRRTSTTSAATQLEAALTALRPSRPGDRLRCDLALQRRARRAGPAQPLPDGHEAAAPAGLHRLRPQRSLRATSRPRSARGSRDGQARLPRDDPRRASRTSRPRSRACSAATTSARCSSASARTTRRLLDRRVEEREPARQILLDRQLVLELRLQLELRRVVALLLADRDERPERAALEAVDPVDGIRRRRRT